MRKTRREKEMNSYNKNDPLTIQQMFGSIADNYDRTNAALSFNMHHYWNQSLVNKMLHTGQADSLLDLCSGTGEITFRYLSTAKNKPQVILLDFCQEMLDWAKKKALQKNCEMSRLTFVQADAQKIPLPDHSVDCATVAYGIRNIKNPALCISEVFRVLKPGGSFGILELTQPSSPILRWGHYIHLKYCLPLLGKLFTSNREAYHYLCNSISTFIPSAKLAGMMQEAGFKEIQQKKHLFGVATILIGKKN